MLETFKTPPSDDSFLLPHWFQHNAQHSPNHPLFVCGSADTDNLKVVTWSKATVAFGRAARVISDKIANVHKQAGDAPLLIGILANLDSLTYYTLAAGILTAGCTTFLISTRNSPAAVSHLLKKTETHLLLVSADTQAQELASAALASALQDGHQTEVLPVPTIEEFYPENDYDESLQCLPEYPKRDLDSPAFILHSSGSTAFPKPIILSHRMLRGLAQSSVISGVNLKTVRFSLHALPVYHAMAFYLLIWAAYTGVSLAFFPPQVPPIIPSPGNILDGGVACKCTFIFCVPLFIELWSRSPQDVEKLKSFDAVVFAGGPLNKDIGDELLRGGVSLAGLYGTTEMGCGCVMLANQIDSEWDWFNARPDALTVYLPQEDEPDIFEIIFLESPKSPLAVSNFEMDGNRAFATGDLVVRHPTNPDKFKIYGRKDDQLMLSTGEKTNPGPLEAIICRDPLVQAAVMFGRGRPQNGILIQPIKGHEIDPDDANALTRFRNSIWPAVEGANEYAPSHSRLYKEMIIVTHPRKPFEMTAKLTPRRRFVLEAYKSEIEAAYVAVEASAHTGIAPPSDWTRDSVYSYVRDTVRHVLDVRVSDDDDIFVNGGDSLKATFIRNSLLKALRQTHKTHVREIPQGFVYSNPSIARLAEQLLVVTGTDSMSHEHDISHKLMEMDDMIAEFSGDFVHHRPSMSQTLSSDEVVLLTGTTGALGSQLLAHLVFSPEVRHVYALNRPDDSPVHKSLRVRQSEALAERGLDINIIDSPKVTLVEGDITTEDFGITGPLLQEIRDSITLIIHNSWRVNFNLALRSFKPMIIGIRNLIDFALQSPRHTPPRFIFSGSVGVFRNRNAPGKALETSIGDPRMALGSGYSESKFVAERILEQAAKSTPLCPVIVRIGQMTSNSSGAWNSGDWVPAIVRSGTVLGALPAREDSVAWIPLDVAAQAIIEFRNSKYQYLHLCHPKLTPWNTLFGAFASSLSVPLVTWAEWLSRLEKSEVGPERNPAVHLLEFFRAFSPLSIKDTELPGATMLDLTHALQSSSTLASPLLRSLTEEDAQKWLDYWKRKGF